MKSSLLFNFAADKENKTIEVTREFAAEPEVVWNAWTKPEILDQWWAPQPYQNRTKSMDFREGGRWHYSMTGPEGDKHWALMDYKTISPKKQFSAIDAFCNEEGEINTSFPQNNWETRFEDSEDGTTVNVTLSFDKLEDLEKLIQMGFKEGFMAALDQLEALMEK